ncbi:MAG: hypothetical protein U1F57_06075 [bacterium]
MDVNLRTRVRYLMECVQGEASNEIIRSQVANLQSYYPEERDSLQRALDCFVATRDPQRCSAENPSPSPASTPPASFSAPASSLCRMITVRGEMALMARQSEPSYQRWLAREVRSREEYRTGASTPERDHLEQMASFYAGQLPPALQVLSRYLRNLPELTARFQAYATRPTATQRLHPPTCTNSRDFIRHDLIVGEVSFAVPVFVPVGFDSQWPVYQERLLEGFELLKVFLTPADLERILHPGGGRNDLSIYIFDNENSAWFQNAFSQLDQCGMRPDPPPRSFYDFPTNRIIFSHANETVISYEMSSGGASRLRPSDLSRTFLHEFSHAIDHFSLDSDQGDVVEGLRGWTQSEIRQGRRIPQLVPSFIYLYGESDPHYALRNQREMFAELATDYMGAELLRFMGGTPDSHPAGRARRALMASFFSAAGLRPEVFTQENVERLFRREGVEMSLSPQMPMPFGMEVRGGFAWDPRGHFGGEFSFDFRSRFSNGPNFFVGPGFRCFSEVGCGMNLSAGISTPALPVQFDVGLSPSFWLPSGSRLNTEFMLGVGGRLVVYPASSRAEGFSLYVGGNYFFNFAHLNQSVPAIDFGLGYTFR